MARLSSRRGSGRVRGLRQAFTQIVLMTFFGLPAFAQVGGDRVTSFLSNSLSYAQGLGIFGAVCHAVAPKVTQVLLNTAFHMFPDSAAAQGKKDGEPQPLTPEQMAFAQLTQGIHW